MPANAAAPIPSKLFRAHTLYGTGPEFLFSKFSFYRLVREGRIRTYRVGGSVFVGESAEEIVLRIDREDREARGAATNHHLTVSA